VLSWISSDWYKQANALNNNFSLYKNNSRVAEEILFEDIPATTVFVEFVNSDKKILNFITKDNKRGFFKYDRLISQVEVADILSVRFRNNVMEDLNHVYTVIKINDVDFESHFIKDLVGEVKLGEGKNFGFVGDIYINPSIVTKYQLINGQKIKVKAIKSWNKEKKNWSWKAIEFIVI
jgi:hypothetical protein